jgi:hypothetical protein
MNDLDFNVNSSAHHAANFIIAALPDDIRIESADHNAINADLVEPLADVLQLTIAIVIASILDAGSEREPVLEDENLRDAIVNQLKEWTA